MKNNQSIRLFMVTVTVVVCIGIVIAFTALPVHLDLPHYNTYLSKKSPPHIMFNNVTPLLSSSQYIEEQAALFDSTPLYLPTEYNFSCRDIHNNVSASLDSVYSLFSYLPQKLSIQQYDGFFKNIYYSPLSVAPAQLLNNDSLLDITLLMRQPSPMCSYAADSFSLHVTPLQNENKIIYQKSFDLSILSLNLSDQSADIWQPIHFLVHINPFIPVVQPIETQSSGNENIDHAVLHFLQTAPWLSGLQPGYYKVQIAIK